MVQQFFGVYSIYDLKCIIKSNLSNDKTFVIAEEVILN